MAMDDTTMEKGEMEEEIKKDSKLDIHNLDDQTDGHYADKLQIEEVLTFSIINSDIIPTGESSNSDSHSNSNSLCEICAEEKLENQMINIEACSHSFCSDCITKHVGFKIKENVNNVSCPGYGCNGRLELDSCRAWISGEIVAMWDDLLFKSMIPESQKYYCPFSDCSVMLIKDNDGEMIKQAECPFCHRLFCAVCRVPFHLGIECEEFQRLNEDERGWGDLMVREMAVKSGWKRCPNCRFFVEKTEGCLHITCRCGFEFCYACGGTWNREHGECRA